MRKLIAQIITVHIKSKGGPSSWGQVKHKFDYYGVILAWSKRVASSVSTVLPLNQIFRSHGKKGND